MNFVAIDLETANADMASICQIGIAKFVNGHLTDEWSTLINPNDYFDFVNISIHGIEEEHVVDAPTIAEVHPQLINLLSGSIVVCHTHFDRVALVRALNKNELSAINISWLDSARVARRAWDECAQRGYGLANVCKIIGYEFKHHDALEDAKACGHVLLAAIEKTGLTVDQWLARVVQPISGDSSPISEDGNPDGDLYGEVLVFTGELELPRREAAHLAASIGCRVASGVTKKTTLLVVGDQDISKFGGKAKSSKHLKAEKLIADGQEIRIIQESDFKRLVEESSA